MSLHFCIKSTIKIVVVVVVVVVVVDGTMFLSNDSSCSSVLISGCAIILFVHVHYKLY